MSFLGRIIDGPFYTTRQTERAQGELAYFVIELISMLIQGQRTVVQSRPRPGSHVERLDPDEVQRLVGAVGDVRLGRLIGQKEVPVALDSATLTRHIGIFGTTGGGKSNSLQVIAEEASKAGRGIVIFDIEGEYVRMDEPTDELRSLLAEFGEKPDGVKTLQVYVPAPNNSRNINAKKFGIPFGDVDLEIFSEVLGLSPFERVYMFDIARKTKDMSGAFQGYTIESVINTLKKRIDAQVDRPNLPEVVAEAHMGLYTKLSLAHRAGILDAHPMGEFYDKIPPEALCMPGKISVIDVSESSDVVRNICIAHLMKEIFKFKTRSSESAPVIIFVEEIHTFLSKTKRRTMLATLTMFTEMARQGRKRGICLGLVSQQPAMIPGELLELCNTRFIHRVSSTANINVLRESTGNVPDSVWSILPSLGKGEVLIASPKYDHSVIAQIRPNRSRRLRVEGVSESSAFYSQIAVKSPR